MNPSPDLIRQVEAESVDSPEFRKALAEYLRASDDPSSCVNDDIKALTAHIDSIITARVAAEREQIATMSFDLSMVSGDAFQEGAAYGIGKYRMAIRALAASQAAPAKAEGWISCDTALPDDNQTVAILYWPYDNRENAQIVGAAIHIDGTFYNHEGEDHHPPSHWCAIPAAPSTPAKEPT